MRNEKERREEAFESKAPSRAHPKTTFDIKSKARNNLLLSRGTMLESGDALHPEMVFGGGAGEPLLTQKRVPRKKERDLI